MLLCQYEVQMSHCRRAVQQSALLAAISDPCPHSWQCTLAFIYIHMYIIYQNIYSYTSRYFPKHIFIIYCAAKCPVGRPLLPPLTLVVGKSFGLETWLGNVISFSFGLSFDLEDNNFQIQVYFLSFYSQPLLALPQKLISDQQSEDSCPLYK